MMDDRFYGTAFVRALSASPAIVHKCIHYIALIHDDQPSGRAGQGRGGRTLAAVFVFKQHVMYERLMTLPLVMI